MKHLWFTSALLALSACGPQAFVPSSSSSSQTPAGSVNVPPKVDIVLGMSSNGTMRNIIPEITAELPAFLENLEKSGWDYRFVSIPLSEYHPTKNLPIEGTVSVSKYDATYPLGTWLSPYPGANHNTAPRISPNLFSGYFDVSQLSPSDPIDAHERGFMNQLDFLYRNDVKNDFLRPDAMLAVITLSNADDRSDWAWGPANTTLLGNATVDNNVYAGYFRNVKGFNAASTTRYYSLVAHNTTSCRGYGTWSGMRYEQMSDLLGGSAKSDICTAPVSSSLEEVSKDLKAVRANFRKKYLVIGNPPNVPTIRVTEYIGGDANRAVIIPQDANNGWTYAGPITSPTYLIDSPLPMNLVNPGDGYLIELHGDAKLTNNTTADVTFQNAGTVSSH